MHHSVFSKKTPKTYHWPSLKQNPLYQADFPTILLHTQQPESYHGFTRVKPGYPMRRGVPSSRINGEIDGDYLSRSLWKRGYGKNPRGDVTKS